MLRQADKRILWAISKNCRLSDYSIGKIAGLSGSAVRKRIESFEKEGIIQKYYTNLYCSSLGVARYLDIYIQARIDDSMINMICNISEVVRVTRYSGIWNLGISLMCVTLEHSNKILDAIKEVIGDKLDSLIVLQFGNSRSLEKDYFLEGDKIDTFVLFDSAGSYEMEFSKSKDYPKGVQAFDEIDLKILESIRHNPRIRITKLSSELEIHREIIKSKIKRMVESKIITKFTATLDYSKLGFQKLNIFLQLNCPNSEQREKIAKQLKTLSGGYYYGEFVSEWDLMFTVVTKNPSQTIAELELIKEKNKEVIKREIILQALKEYKHSAYPSGIAHLYKYAVDIFTGGGELIRSKKLAYEIPSIKGKRN